MPKLYRQIMTKIEEADAQHIASIRKTEGGNAEEEIKKYERARWKYLIFFDEINRVDDRTFNALRKVILEKDFGPAGDDSGEDMKLPKESVVVAAMNPEGAGTSELTHHFRDVVDIIPADPSWKDTKKFLSSLKYKNVSDHAVSAAISVIDTFVHKFQDKQNKVPADQKPFYLEMASGIQAYVSPREYQDLQSTMAREIDAAVKTTLADPQVKDDVLRDAIDEAVTDSLIDVLNMVFYKHGLDMKTFAGTARQWVSTLPDTLFAGLMQRKVKYDDTLQAAFEQYMQGIRDLTDMPNDEVLVNSNNNMNHSQVMQDIQAAVSSLVVDGETAHKYIIDQTDPEIVLDGETLKTNQGKKVSPLWNVIIGLLYTLHIHQYQHDRIAVIGKALSKSMSDLRSSLVKSGKLNEADSDAATEAVVELRGHIVDVVAAL